MLFGLCPVIDTNEKRPRLLTIVTSHTSRAVTFANPNALLVDALTFLYNLTSLRRKFKPCAFVGFRLQLFAECLFSELDAKRKDILFDLAHVAEARQIFGDTLKAIDANRSKTAAHIAAANYLRAQIKKLSEVTIGSFIVKYHAKHKLSISRISASGKRRHGITLYDLQGFTAARTLNEAAAAWLKQSAAAFAPIEAAPLLAFADLEQNKRRAYDNAKLIARIGVQIQNALTANDLPFTWAGTSAIAGRLLKRWNVADEAKPANELNSPPHLLEAFNSAYFGGRSELFKLGTINAPVYTYDINAAYAWAICQLSQAVGRWRFTRHWTPAPFSLWLLSFDFRDISPLGLLPHRGHNQTTTYPLTGEAWAWQPEAARVLQAYPDRVQAIKGYWQPFTPVSFSAGVRQLYRYRQDANAANAPTVETYKRILVSLYGKFAQVVGSAQLARRYYAGFITSLIRGRLIDAAQEAGDSLIYFGQDSIHCTKPLTLDTGNDLGQWKTEVFSAGVYLAAGVYRLTRADGSYKVATRGVQSLDFARALTDIARNGKTITPLTFFTGWKLARNGYAARYMEKQNNSLELRPANYWQFADNGALWQLAGAELETFGKLLTDCYDLAPPLAPASRRSAPYNARAFHALIEKMQLELEQPTF